MTSASASKQIGLVQAEAQPDMFQQPLHATSDKAVLVVCPPLD